MASGREGADYETQRQRHVQALVERLPGEDDKMTWPLGRLHSVRDDRLRALVKVARTRSAWHARRLQHVDPDRVRGDNLGSLPTMTKADLMANWDQIVTDPRLTLERANAHLAHVAASGPAYLHGEYHVVASGGASGMRAVFPWDFDGWLELGLVVQRPLAWLDRQSGWSGERRRAWVMAGAATHMTTALARTFAGVGAAGVSRSFPVSLPLTDMVTGLNDFDPTHVTAYPSILHRLALEAQAGRLHIAPRQIGCGSEPLLPEARQAIEAAFGPVFNTYATSEAGIMARSFPGQPGLHLSEDVAVFEPVDADGRPVPPGTLAAKLLVTNVINKALPLIRYELTDEVTFLAEPNPGPWTGRRIADIQGRLDDSFRYPDGVEVHPHVFRSALGQLANVSEYQVRQTTRGATISVRTTGDADLALAQRQLTRSLELLGVADPQISIIAVEQIDRLQATGKLQRFIPLAT